MKYPSWREIFARKVGAETHEGTAAGGCSPIPWAESVARARRAIPAVGWVPIRRLRWIVARIRVANPWDRVSTNHSASAASPESSTRLRYLSRRLRLRPPHPHPPPPPQNRKQSAASRDHFLRVVVEGRVSEGRAAMATEEVVPEVPVTEVEAAAAEEAVEETTAAEEKAAKPAKEKKKAGRPPKEKKEAKPAKEKKVKEAKAKKPRVAAAHPPYAEVLTVSTLRRRGDSWIEIIGWVLDSSRSIVCFCVFGSDFVLGFFSDDHGGDRGAEGEDWIELPGHRQAHPCQPWRQPAAQLPQAPLRQPQEAHRRRQAGQGQELLQALLHPPCRSGRRRRQAQGRPRHEAQGQDHQGREAGCQGEGSCYHQGREAGDQDQDQGRRRAGGEAQGVSQGEGQDRHLAGEAPRPPCQVRQDLCQGLACQEGGAGGCQEEGGGDQEEGVGGCGAGCSQGCGEEEHEVEVAGDDATWIGLPTF